MSKLLRSSWGRSWSWWPRLRKAKIGDQIRIPLAPLPDDISMRRLTEYKVGEDQTISDDDIANIAQIRALRGEQ
jgi:hypothetical protein